MDGMRLNMSHTTLQKSSVLLETYRHAAAASGKEAELLTEVAGRVRVPVEDWEK